MRNNLILILLILAGLPLQAQESGESGGEKEVRQGFAAGLYYGHRGLGAGVEFYMGRDARQYLFSLDLYGEKDLRENYIEPVSGNRGRRYIFGKLNRFAVLAPAAGVQFNLIPAYAGNRVNLRGDLRAGPAIGMLSPYYLEVYSANPTSPIEVEAYDPDEHSYLSIAGRAGLLSSPLRPDVLLGLSARGNLLFDFGRNSRHISGLR
ncbi:MAG: hypothetical protein EAZ89_02775, partial [Bacteroidetes bacterium]